MRDPNEEKPLKTIDDVIIRSLATLFLICLIIIQVVLMVVLALCKLVTYPFEFLCGFILEAKDVCRQAYAGASSADDTDKPR